MIYHQLKSKNYDVSDLEEVCLAFNWIGPAGPMPNAEMPTVINIASCIHGVQIPHEQYRYMDDQWSKIVPIIAPYYGKSNYRVIPTSSLDVNTKFILPFVLGHKISFSHNFSSIGDIIREGGTLHQVLDLIRHHNGYILIDHALEAFVWDSHLNEMLHYFNHYQIPMNKVIYVTGTGNTQKIYAEYIMRNGILPEDRMHLVQHFPSTQNFATETTYNDDSVEPTYVPEELPEHKFLSWNKRSRMHRVVLAALFAKHHLLEHSLFSLQEHDDSGSLKGSVNMQQIHEHGLDHEDLELLWDHLPMEIDNIHERSDPIYDGQADMSEYYRQTLVSVCTETSFHTNIMALTEKCIKPIKYKHPFILVASQGTLARIKEFGYKTFDKWWDESYDDMIDHRERMDAIVEICKDIATWDDAKVLEFRKDVAEILDHNYKVFTSEPWSHAYDEIYDIVANQRVL